MLEMIMLSLKCCLREFVIQMFTWPIMTWEDPLIQWCQGMSYSDKLSKLERMSRNVLLEIMQPQDASLNLVLIVNLAKMMMSNIVSKDLFIPIIALVNLAFTLRNLTYLILEVTLEVKLYMKDSSSKYHLVWIQKKLPRLFVQE